MISEDIITKNELDVIDLLLQAPLEWRLESSYMERISESPMIMVNYTYYSVRVEDLLISVEARETVDLDKEEVRNYLKSEKCEFRENAYTLTIDKYDKNFINQVFLGDDNPLEELIHKITIKKEMGL